MRVSKGHPVANWLRVERAVYSSSFDQVLRHRDEQMLEDPSASGLPPASREWFWTQQLPALVADPKIRDQVLNRLDELAARRQELENQIRLQAGALIERQAEIDTECALLEQVLE